MNYKRFKWYLIVDVNGRPMAYQQIGKGGQLCYCSTEIQRRPHAAKRYTLKQARALIKSTVKFRQSLSLGASELDYVLMPIT